MNKKFNWRNFTSLYMTISFLIMLVSGVILFLAPPGRIANWSYWAILGLTKKEWQSVHIIFTFLFIVAGSFHIYFNWKPLLFYLKTKKINTIKIRYELLLTIVTSFIIFAFTLLKIPPISNFLDFGEYLTESWEDDQNAPPVSHAERLTLFEFAKNENIGINKIKNTLSDAGIKFNSEENTLEEIAELNNISPQQLFDKIKVQAETQNSSINGRGLGRKTIEEICLKENISLDQAKTRFELKNIIFDKSKKLKDLADQNNLTPLDLYNILIDAK